MKQHNAGADARERRRQVWLTMPCPYCQQPAGERCKGVRGNVRFASHQERWDLYRERAAVRQVH